MILTTTSSDAVWQEIQSVLTPFIASFKSTYEIDDDALRHFCLIESKVHGVVAWASFDYLTASSNQIWLLAFSLKAALGKMRHVHNTCYMQLNCHELQNLKARLAEKIDSHNNHDAGSHNSPTHFLLKKQNRDERRPNRRRSIQWRRSPCTYQLDTIKICDWWQCHPEDSRHRQKE